MQRTIIIITIIFSASKYNQATSLFALGGLLKRKARYMSDHFDKPNATAVFH